MNNQIKIIHYCTTFFILLFSASFAQNNNVLYTPLTFEFQNISIDSALNIIEKEINHYFTYNAEFIANKPIVSETFKELPLSIILDSLFNNPLLVYKTIKKQIIIYKNEKNESEIIPIDTIQEYKIIQGMVIDSEENTSLSFSTISIFNKGVGTICNQDGKFNIKISKKYFSDTLVVSHLGYEPFFINVSNIDTITTIKLTKKFISLQEIVIRWRDPKEILINALVEAKNNYSDVPAQLRTFYRESLKRNDKYMFYAEGLLDIYKNAYRPTLFNDRSNLLQLRRFSNIETKDSILIKLQGGANTCLSLDLLKNPLDFISYNGLNLYTYYYNGIETIDDEMAYIIKFEPLIINNIENFSGTIYIDIKTYAIVKIQFEKKIKNKRQSAKEIIVKSKPGINLYPENINYSISYKKSNNKYHIYHVLGNLNFKVKKRGKFFSSIYKIHFEMITTDITTQNIEKIKGNKILKSNQIISDLDQTYLNNINKYWGINNFILPEDNLFKALTKFNVQELQYSN